MEIVAQTDAPAPARCHAGRGVREGGGALAARRRVTAASPRARRRRRPAAGGGAGGGARRAGPRGGGGDGGAVDEGEAVPPGHLVVGRTVTARARVGRGVAMGLGPVSGRVEGGGLGAWGGFDSPGPVRPGGAFGGGGAVFGARERLPLPTECAPTRETSRENSSVKCFDDRLSGEQGQQLVGRSRLPWFPESAVAVKASCEQTRESMIWRAAPHDASSGTAQG